jgi:APA family basic amino acid/polyamine antiporter
VFGGGIAFTVVMSGYVIWILQWVALSGWLLSYLGFAPLFLGLGATTGSAAMSSLGIWFTSSTGIIITSILNAFVAMMILISGFKNYVRFQSVMIVGTLIAFLTMLIVLFTGSPATSMGKIDTFAEAISGVQNFVQTAKDASVANGVDLNPPFSLIATLLVAPIAWTSLQWATYSAQQNGEIKNARSFNSQAFIIVGSLIFTGILLAILAAALEKAVGTEFLYVAGAGYWLGLPEALISGFYLWPNMIAVALSASPFIIILIGIGYILNSHQIVHNCYIGMTRVMVAMSLDRLLPEWISAVDEKRHTPANAHWAYFIASIPVILVYNLWGAWVGLTLGVTFACGYVFVITCLAGALLPYRAKDVYEASPGAKYKIGNTPLVTIMGAVGFVLGGAMVLMFMFYSQLGLTSTLAYIVVFGVLAVSAIWYFLAKNAQKAKGINVDFAFKEIPPE